MSVDQRVTCTGGWSLKLNWFPSARAWCPSKILRSVQPQRGQKPPSSCYSKSEDVPTWTIWGVPSSWGYPKIYKGKSHVEMDYDWGYPHLWNPPFQERQPDNEFLDHRQSYQSSSDGPSRSNHTFFQRQSSTALSPHLQKKGSGSGMLGYPKSCRFKLDHPVHNVAILRPFVKTSGPKIAI